MARMTVREMIKRAMEGDKVCCGKMFKLYLYDKSQEDMNLLIVEEIRRLFLENVVKYDLDSLEGSFMVNACAHENYVDTAELLVAYTRGFRF